MSYKTINVYQGNEVMVKDDNGNRQTMSRSGFRKFILGLSNGDYAFTGAPRYRYPGAPTFHFYVKDGNVTVRNFYDSVPPTRSITKLEELAEFMLDASTPEGKPYGLHPYSDGHPNYWGHLSYL